jgi:[ribosomal protein S5]-alanine N-acetyltransferase
MQNKIVTQRLCLNWLAPEDADFVLLLLNTKGWITFIGDRNVHSKEDAVAYITKICNTQNLFYWVVKLKKDNTPVGIISFLKRSYLNNFDIGFAFLPQFNGQGYAFEAAAKVLSVVSKKQKYYPVLATTVPQNVHSIKLLTKLGLRFEKTIEVENEQLHIYTTNKL